MKVEYSWEEQATSVIEAFVVCVAISLNALFVALVVFGVLEYLL